MSEDTKLHQMLGEISSDVKHVLIKQNDQSERIDRLSRRVNSLEVARGRIYGAIAVIPTAFSAALYMLSRGN